MAERNELTIFGQLVAGFFAQFAQRDVLNLPLIRIVVIDLSGDRFPDRLADWDALLANEDDFAVARHRSDNNGCFAMHDCPRARLAPRRRSNLIGDDVDVSVRKVPFARGSFPRVLLHAERL